MHRNAVVSRIGCKYGSHRALDPKGSMPQSAWKICNDTDIFDNEILVDVEALHVNSTSFAQILIECNRDLEQVKRRIMDIVNLRGKLHNPVTGSGGMLVGRIAKVGPLLINRIAGAVGDKIATLVSLSLTPLKLDVIEEVNLETGQVKVQGKAVLFESGVFELIPEDLPVPLLLSALDCAGAPARTASLVKKGDTVLILGAGGRTGLLCLAMAREKIGREGKIVAFVRPGHGFENVQKTGISNYIVVGDATNPMQAMELYKRQMEETLADVVINCINIPGTEMASILLARPGGTIFFANLATSFNAAALGAEGIGKDVDMLIYRGYVEGHAGLVINLLRKNRILRDILAQISGS